MFKNTKQINPIIWSSPKTHEGDDRNKFSLVEVGSDFITIYYGSKYNQVNELEQALKGRQPERQNTIPEITSPEFIKTYKFYQSVLPVLRHGGENSEEKYHSDDSQGRLQKEIFHLHLKHKHESYFSFNDFVKCILNYCEEKFNEPGLVENYENFLSTTKNNDNNESPGLSRKF